MLSMYELASTSMEAFRYCSNCTLERPSLGGYWKIADNRKSRRWVCKGCYDKKFKQTP
jgi:hypothetical protein